jgi:DNA-directed RNA polymerase subunit beta'
MRTLGQHLVDAVLPKGWRHDDQALTKGVLNDSLVRLAKSDPSAYPEVVTRLKRLGDEVATLEGISVGLDDIAPHPERDAMLAPHVDAFHAARTHADREKALFAAQDAMLSLAKRDKGAMGEMVRSGGRGNAAQLMRAVGSPVLARDSRDRTVPWLIKKSFSEGLTPADAWVAGGEARVNAVRSNISVVEPGDLAKILVNNMGDKLITTLDCGTRNGIEMAAADPHLIDRYLTDGRLVTPGLASSIAAKGDPVTVRSPMTCEAPHGICQRCQGLDPSGHPHVLGTNVGMRAAQALSEPLTQFSLNAKHGGRVAAAATDKKQLEGIKGVRQLLEIPTSFLHKAVLADRDGKVGIVEPAPQGGAYVTVEGSRHYVPPDQRVTVAVGQPLFAGDTLSDGVPRPDEIVRHKGLGEGRRYLVDALHDVYRRAGADVDKRHLETLARSVLSHVQIIDPGPDDAFMKGDVIDYNRFRAALAASHRRVGLAEAAGETLAQDAFHFTAGTRVTPDVASVLARRGVHEVNVADNAPMAAPLMRPASRTPLLNPDWMARLGHRYLKESLLAGAHRGDHADVHGYSPVPAYAAGTEFGQGPEGRY